MEQEPLKLKIIGIPHIPSITQVNVRPDASTNGNVVFKVDVGLSDIIVINVKEDSEKREQNGKIYQWFHAQFPQGTGWVRDDLIEIWGDGTTVGYPIIKTPIQAFELTRQDDDTLPQGAEIAPRTTQIVHITDEPAVIVETIVEPEPEPINPTITAEIPVSIPLGTPTAMAMTSYPAKLRSGPGTGHNPPLASMPYRDTADILDSRMGDDGKPLNWLKVNYKGTIGWTREDLVRLSGNFESFGLNSPDKYPSPVPESSWIRGWDKDGSIWNTGKHDGWDHAGKKGVAIYAGPEGGVVYQKMLCTKCTSQGFSTLERGLSLYDARVYSDQGWNFGYGHYLIVGYENRQLPKSTRDHLVSIGRGGQHIFVMYAHCQDLMVEAGDILTRDQQIATLGNSGNSSGPHLHLEVRISETLQPRAWYAIKSGISSPGILFLR
ncbi:MAG: hypothetical protein Phog2KO_13890 [Phototrophicaceae bacterium]